MVLFLKIIMAIIAVKSHKNGILYPQRQCWLLFFVINVTLISDIFLSRIDWLMSCFFYVSRVTRLFSYKD